jgi:hypothetical protein
VALAGAAVAIGQAMRRRRALLTRDGLGGNDLTG